MSIGKAIAIIGGVAVGAVGAYNFSSTGCLFGTEGSCDASSTAAVQTVAGTDEACPLGCSMDAGAEVLAVSTTEEASCCSTEGAVEVATEAADSCCSADASASECSESDATQTAEECDASACTEGEACCKAQAEEVASND